MNSRGLENIVRIFHIPNDIARNVILIGGLSPMCRYKEEFKRLADVHWPDNLLLVTHEYGVLAGIELGGTTEPMEATYCGCVELIRTDRTQHNWTIGQCHGVYKYDTIE